MVIFIVGVSVGAVVGFGISAVLSVNKRIVYKNVDLCVCCGNIIPEGRQVCPTCERLADK